MDNRISFIEKYHDNCHDYLKRYYIERYASKEYKNLLYVIIKRIPKLDICDETNPNDYDKIIVCDQHAVIFGASCHQKSILATYALNSCIGLIMYAPAYRVGSVSHFDGLPGYSKEHAREDGLDISFSPVQYNIDVILRKIRSYCKTDDNILIQFYLVGGIFDLSEVMIHDILYYLSSIDSRYRFDFRGRNLLGPENQSRNICLNTMNGKITHFDIFDNSEKYLYQRSDEGIADNIISAPYINAAILDVTWLPMIC